MNGLIYKELRQKRLYLLSAALALVFAIWFPVIGITLIDDGTLEDTLKEIGTVGALLRMFFVTCAFYVVGMLQSALFTADENKKWGYFIASAPNGGRMQVYYKYVITFMMSCIAFMVGFLADSSFCTLTYRVTGEETMGVSGIMVLLVYFQLFLRSIEMPFSVRFGAKKGGVVKAVFLLIVLLAGIIYLLFGPLPGNFEEFLEALFEFFEKLQNGDIPDGLFFVQSLLPFAAVGCYVLSYFISRNLYLKGVEEYDK